MTSGSDEGLDWVEKVPCSSKLLSDIWLEEQSALKMHLLVRQMMLECRGDNGSDMH